MTRLRSLCLLTTAVIAADQVGKLVFSAADDNHEWINPVINPDTALGLISASSGVLLALTVSVLAVSSTYVVSLVRRGMASWIAALLIGGATSNLIDRMLFSSVRDFIEIPGVIINLADMALVVGSLGSIAFQVRTRLLNEPAARGR
jgi:lipoprotein signal peptidase